MKTASVRLGDQIFRVELPQTAEEFAQGLMFRNALPPRTGMLFDFGVAQQVAMWMKNCRISLDMVFVRDGRVVHIVASAPPCQSDVCPSYIAPEPVDCVIELAGGTAQAIGLRVGSKVQRIQPKALVLPAVPLRG